MFSSYNHEKIWNLMRSWGVKKNMGHRNVVLIMSNSYTDTFHDLM
jgi:hypothetical protein